MSTWQQPGDPTPEQRPPDDGDEDRSPFERPPFDQDPEAQHAPGANEQETDAPPPPMQASSRAGAGGAEGGDVLVLDAAGSEREPVGNDNIRDGTVKGVMGPPHASNGQGQGG